MTTSQNPKDWEVRPGTYKKYWDTYVLGFALSVYYNYTPDTRAVELTTVWYNGNQDILPMLSEEFKQAIIERVSFLEGEKQ